MEKISIKAPQTAPINPHSVIWVKVAVKARFNRSAPIILLIITVPPVEIIEKIMGKKFIIEFALPTAATESSLYPLSTAELIKPIIRVATVSNKSGNASVKTFKAPSDVVTEKSGDLKVFCNKLFAIFRG